MKYWAHSMPYIFIYLNNISLQLYNYLKFELIENIEKMEKFCNIPNWEFLDFEQNNGPKKQYQDNKTQQSNQMY